MCLLKQAISQKYSVFQAELAADFDIAAGSIYFEN